MLSICFGIFFVALGGKSMGFSGPTHWLFSWFWLALKLETLSGVRLGGGRRGKEYVGLWLNGN